MSDFDAITDPLFFQGAPARDFFIFQIDLDSGTLQSIGVAMQQSPGAISHEALGYLEGAGLVTPSGANTNATNPQFEFFAPNDLTGNATSARLFVTYAPGSLPPTGIDFPFLMVPPDTVRFMINDGIGLVDFDGTIVVPEPATVAMIGLGLLTAFGAIRRRD